MTEERWARKRIAVCTEWLEYCYGYKDHWDASVSFIENAARSGRPSSPTNACSVIFRHSTHICCFFEAQYSQAKEQRVGVYGEITICNVKMWKKRKRITPQQLKLAQ